MDREFQIAVLWQKAEYARSTDPNKVCDGASDILSTLEVLGIDDDELLAPVETAYDIADVSLGLGNKRLEAPYSDQVFALIDQFVEHGKRLIAENDGSG